MRASGTISSTILALVILAAPAGAQDRVVRPSQTQVATLDRKVDELQKQVSALQSQLQAIERQLARSAGSSNQVGFTEQGSDLVLEHNGARIRVGASGVDVEGTVVTLKGGLVKLNNGSRPIARLGDTTKGTAPLHTIVGGSPTVLVP